MKSFYPNMEETASKISSQTQVHCHQNGLALTYYYFFRFSDSFMLALRTKNLVRDIQEMKFHFDTSNYPKDHPLYSKENENRLFKVKDEAKGASIVRFCGLKAKCYAFETKQKGKSVEKHVAKGVQRSVINQSLRMKNYLSALNEEKKLFHQSHTIRAKNNQLSTYKIKRMSLNSFDNKRLYFAPPNYDTWALFHYKYRKNQQ